MKTITGHKGIFTNDTPVQVCTYACKLPHTRRSGTNISRLLQFRFPRLLLGCLEVVVLLYYLLVFSLLFSLYPYDQIVQHSLCLYHEPCFFFLEQKIRWGGGGGGRDFAKVRFINIADFIVNENQIIFVTCSQSS